MQSRRSVNPITGEEMNYSSRASSASTTQRETEVPHLDFLKEDNSIVRSGRKHFQKNVEEESYSSPFNNNYTDTSTSYNAGRKHFQQQQQQQVNNNDTSRSGQTVLSWGSSEASARTPSATPLQSYRLNSPYATTLDETTLINRAKSSQRMQGSNNSNINNINNKYEQQPMSLALDDSDEEYQTSSPPPIKTKQAPPPPPQGLSLRLNEVVSPMQGNYNNNKSPTLEDKWMDMVLIKQRDKTNDFVTESSRKRTELMENVMENDLIPSQGGRRLPASSNVTTAGQAAASSSLSYRETAAAVKALPGLSSARIASAFGTGPFRQNELLSRRVRFNARIISANPVEALREFTGFFFHDDNTLTVYELRLVARNIKTFPYLNRSVYTAAWGRRKGQQYVIFDIFEGNTIFVNNNNNNNNSQTSFGQTNNKRNLLRFKITDVDEKSWREILESELSGSESGKSLNPAQWNKIICKLQISHCCIEPDVQLNLHNLQGKIQKFLRERSPLKVWMSLYLIYDRLSAGGGRSLSREQLETGLDEAGLNFTFSEMDCIWSALNPIWNDANLHDGDGDNVDDDIPEDELRNYLSIAFHFTDYMRTALGEMNEFRRRFVRKAFQSVDVGKRGFLDRTELGRFYRRPRLTSGYEKSRIPLDYSEMTDTMFNHNQKKTEVSFIEYELYYEAISVLFIKDEEFITFVKDSWSV